MQQGCGTPSFSRHFALALSKRADQHQRLRLGSKLAEARFAQKKASLGRLRRSEVPRGGKAPNHLRQILRNSAHAAPVDRGEIRLRSDVGRVPASRGSSGGRGRRGGASALPLVPSALSLVRGNRCGGVLCPCGALCGPEGAGAQEQGRPKLSLCCRCAVRAPGDPPRTAGDSRGPSGVFPKYPRAKSERHHQHFVHRPHQCRLEPLLRLLHHARSPGPGADQRLPGVQVCTAAAPDRCGSGRQPAVWRQQAGGSGPSLAQHRGSASFAISGLPTAWQEGCPGVGQPSNPSASVRLLAGAAASAALLQHHDSRAAAGAIRLSRRAGGAAGGRVVRDLAHLRRGVVGALHSGPSHEAPELAGRLQAPAAVVAGTTTALQPRAGVSEAPDAGLFESEPCARAGASATAVCAERLQLRGAGPALCALLPDPSLPSPAELHGRLGQGRCADQRRQEPHAESRGRRHHRGRAAEDSRRHRQGGRGRARHGLGRGGHQVPRGLRLRRRRCSDLDSQLRPRRRGT
eukprot:scaffold48_cov311-Pinguiococcus_pyrenoidosus.AAC.137